MYELPQTKGNITMTNKFSKHPCDLSDSAMIAIHKAVMNQTPRIEVAKRYDVSPRTIGRVVKIVEDETFHVEPNIEIETKAEHQVKFSIIASQRCITVTKSGEGKRASGFQSIDSKNPRFELVMDMVKASDLSDASLEKIYNVIDYKKFIENFCDGDLTVDPESGTAIFLKGTNKMKLSFLVS